MLDDVRHVEAVAIIRALIENPYGPFVSIAEHWIETNHPPPDAYVAAMSSLVVRDTPEESK